MPVFLRFTLFLLCLSFLGCSFDDEIKRSNENVERSIESMETTNDNMDLMQPNMDVIARLFPTLIKQMGSLEVFLGLFDRCFDKAISANHYAYGSNPPPGIASVIPAEILNDTRNWRTSADGSSTQFIIPEEYYGKITPRSVIVLSARPYSECEQIGNSVADALKGVGAKGVQKVKETLLSVFRLATASLDDAYSTRIDKDASFVPEKIDCLRYRRLNAEFHALIAREDTSQFSLKAALGKLFGGEAKSKLQDELEKIAAEHGKINPCREGKPVALLDESDVGFAVKMNNNWLGFVESWQRLRDNTYENDVIRLPREISSEYLMNQLDFPVLEHPLARKYYHGREQNRRVQLEAGFVKFFNLDGALEALATMDVDKVATKMNENMNKATLPPFSVPKGISDPNVDGKTTPFDYSALRLEHAEIIKEVTRFSLDVLSAAPNKREEERLKRVMAKLLTRAIFVLWEQQLQEKRLFGVIQPVWDARWSAQDILAIGNGSTGNKDDDSEISKISEESLPDLDETKTVATAPGLDSNMALSLAKILEWFYQKVLAFDPDQKAMKRIFAKRIQFFQADFEVDLYELLEGSDNPLEKRFARLWKRMVRKSERNTPALLGELSEQINAINAFYVKIRKDRSAFREFVTSSNQFPVLSQLFKTIPLDAPLGERLERSLETYDPLVIREEIESRMMPSPVLRLNLLAMSAVVDGWKRSLFESARARHAISAKLKVLTLNAYLLYTNILSSEDVGTRSKKIAKEIAKLDPDVVVFQELFPSLLTQGANEIVWPIAREPVPRDFVRMKKEFAENDVFFETTFLERPLVGKRYQAPQQTFERWFSSFMDLLEQGLFKGEDSLPADPAIVHKLVAPSTPSDPLNLGPSGLAIFAKGHIDGRVKGNKMPIAMNSFGSHFHYLHGRQIGQFLGVPLSGGFLQGLFGLEGLGVISVATSHLTTMENQDNRRFYQIYQALKAFNKQMEDPGDYARSEMRRFIRLRCLDPLMKDFSVCQSFASKKSFTDEELENQIALIVDESNLVAGRRESPFYTKELTYFSSLRYTQIDGAIWAGDFNAELFGDRAKLAAQRGASSWPMGLLFNRSSFRPAGPLFGDKMWATLYPEEDGKASSTSGFILEGLDKVGSIASKFVGEKDAETLKQILQKELLGDISVDRFSLPKKIDYVFYQENPDSSLLMVPLEKQIVLEDSGLSDHAGVMVNFGLLR